MLCSFEPEGSNSLPQSQLRFFEMYAPARKKSWREAWIGNTNKVRRLICCAMVGPWQLVELARDFGFVLLFDCQPALKPVANVQEEFASVGSRASGF